MEMLFGRYRDLSQNLDKLQELKVLDNGQET